MTSHSSHRVLRLSSSLTRGRFMVCVDSVPIELTYTSLRTLVSLISAFVEGRYAGLRDFRVGADRLLLYQRIRRLRRSFDHKLGVGEGQQIIQHVAMANYSLGVESVEIDEELQRYCDFILPESSGS